MLRDITIGQYYPAESVIHKLDPRTKILGSFMMIIALFVITPLWGYLIPFGTLALVILLSKVPLKFILKGLKPILFFMIFAVSINVFFTPGKVIFSYGFIEITMEGLERALMTLSRFVFLIITSSMVTLTTSPMALTDGIEKLLNPLKVIKFPAHELAMMMTIALRFIPTLIEEADKIMKAQTARGADFETGNIFNRAKNMIPLLVPLFISAFRRADELAMAMEARCYRGGVGRTRMKQLRFNHKDVFALVFSVLYCISIMIAL
ncbi:MAG: energy-coupling factor transporter transmembrane protein EcfT [Clostridia bacterium]|nr:energy-coupling factor transporter transmembrane protein EcfT [Clostridia bacterium]